MDWLVRDCVVARKLGSFNCQRLIVGLFLLLFEALCDFVGPDVVAGDIVGAGLTIVQFYFVLAAFVYLQFYVKARTGHIVAIFTKGDLFFARLPCFEKLIAVKDQRDWRWTGEASEGMRHKPANVASANDVDS